MTGNGYGILLALLGAALSLLLPGWGSAKSVGFVGEKASGIITEDPGKFAQTLVLQALPGTQGIYGFLIAFMILLKTGVLGGGLIAITNQQGMAFLIGALPVAVVGWFSAWYQGRVSAAALGIVAKNPGEVAKGITFAAMVETFAILAFVGSLLIVLGIRV